MRCVIVAPTWLLMSSPTIGTPASVNFCAHSGSLAMNTGIAFTNADAGVEARLRVVALRLLGADRQVAHEHVGAACRAAPARRRPARPATPRRSRGSTCRGRRTSGARCTCDAELADVGELDRVVLAGEDRLAEVETDLGGVDVERGDELDVADVVAAEHDVHEARARRRRDRRCGSTRRPGRGCSRSSRLRRWRHGCDHS